MGRPAKLTSQVQDKIVSVIRGGNYNDTAAEMAGVCERTFYHWMSRGEEEQEGKYFQFFQSVKKAMAEAEALHVGVIATAARKSWQASAWFLERKYPQKWGRRVPDAADSESEGKLSVKMVRRILEDAGMET